MPWASASDASARGDLAAAYAPAHALVLGGELRTDEQYEGRRIRPGQQYHDRPQRAVDPLVVGEGVQVEQEQPLSHLEQDGGQDRPGPHVPPVGLGVGDELVDHKEDAEAEQERQCPCGGGGQAVLQELHPVGHVGIEVVHELKGRGRRKREQKQQPHPECHGQVVELVDVEGAVLVDVPGAVYRPAYRPEDRARHQEQAHEAYDPEDAPYPLGRLEVGLEGIGGARKVRLEKVQELCLYRLRLKDRVDDRQQADREGEQGEDRVVGDAGGHVRCVVVV